MKASEVVVDLRGEATECAYPAANVKWVQIPFADNAGQTQEEGFQKAIKTVTDFTCFGIKSLVAIINYCML
jgi:hypothetical protein